MSPTFRQIEEAAREKAEKPRKRKPKPPISGEGRAGASDEVALKHFNAPTIESLNKKVASFTKAHNDELGYNPPPGLTRDVVRAPVFERDYANLMATRDPRGMQKRASEGMSAFNALPPEQQRGAQGVEVSEALSGFRGILLDEEGHTPEQTLLHDETTWWFEQQVAEVKAQGLLGPTLKSAALLKDVEDLAKISAYAEAKGRADHLGTKLWEEYEELTGESLTKEIGMLAEYGPEWSSTTSLLGLAGHGASKFLQEWFPRGFQFVWDQMQNSSDPVRISGRDAIVNAGLGATLEFTGRAWEQVGIGLAYMPAGLIQIALAAGMDVDALTHGQFDEAMNLWVITQDFTDFAAQALRDPLTYPGDALFMAWAVASLGAGALGRAGATARVVAAGKELSTVEGTLPKHFGQVAKAVLRRPPSSSVNLMGQAIQLSENRAARFLSEMFINHKQKTLDRLGHPDSEASHVGVPALLDGIVQSRTASNKRMSATRQARIKFQLAQADTNMVLRTARGAAKGQSVMKLLLGDNSFKLWFTRQKSMTQLGVQKAAQVLATDARGIGWEAQIAGERSFRLRILGDNEALVRLAVEDGTSVKKVADNQRAQLTALDHAEEVLRSDRPDLQRVHEVTRDMSHKTEQFRKGEFGLNEVYAQDRLVRVQAATLGEALKSPPQIEQLIRARIDRVNELVGEQKLPTRSTQTAMEKRIVRLEKDIARRDKAVAGLEARQARADRGQVDPKVQETVDSLQRDIVDLDKQVKASTDAGEKAGLVSSLKGLKAELKRVKPKRAAAADRPLTPRQHKTIEDARRMNAEAKLKIEDAKSKEVSQPGSENVLTDAQGRPELSTALSPSELKIKEAEMIVEHENLLKALDDPRLLDDPEGLGRELGFTRAEIEAQVEHLQGIPTNPDAYYWQASRTVFPEKKRGLPPLAPSAGVAGLAPFNPRKQLPALHHRFTGDSIIMGDFRVDVSNLTAESHLRTVRAVTLKHEFQRHWDNGHESILVDGGKRIGPPRGLSQEHMIPVRDISSIDEAGLRAASKVIDDGVVTELDARGLLTDKKIDELRNTLFPGEIKRTADGVRFEIPADANYAAEHVRWIDMRDMMDPTKEREFWKMVDKVLSGRSQDLSPGVSRGVARAVKGTFVPANEAMRMLNLFLTPKYALNALGAAALLFHTAGAGSPLYLGMAMGSRKFFGRELTDKIDSLGDVKGGKSKSYIDTRLKITQPSQIAQKFWVQVTDAMFRRASVMHELERRGYRTRKQMQDLFDNVDDPKILQTITEIENSSNRAMVRFNELDIYSQSVMRHIFFIWPWIFKSATWSINNLVDHPVKGFVEFEVGHDSEQEIRDAIGLVGDRFLQAGYWIDDEASLSVRGSQFMHPTKAFWDLMNPVADLLTVTEDGFDMETLVEMFGGGSEMVFFLATGRDLDGNVIEGNRVTGAAKELFENTSTGALYHRQTTQRSSDLGEPDIRDPLALIKRESKARRQTWFENEDKPFGINDPFVSGMLAKRGVHEERQNAEFWSPQNKDVRLAHGIDQLNTMLDAQADLIKQPLPDSVRRAREFLILWEKRRTDIKHPAGTDPPVREKAVLQADLLVEQGFLTPARAKELKEEFFVGKASWALDTTTVKAAAALMKEEALGMEKVRAWQREVDYTAFFLKQESEGGKVQDPLPIFLHGVNSIGLGNYKGASKDARVLHPSSEKSRVEYGHNYFVWTEEERLFKQLLKAPSTRTSEKKEARKLRRNALIDDDVPQKVGNQTFPSFEELTWGVKKEAERNMDILALVQHRYENMSRVEKILYGRKDVDNTVQRGWVSWDLTLEAEAASENGPLTEDEKPGVVASIDRLHPGFREDYQFSRLSRAEKFRESNVFKVSKFEDKWNELFLNDAVDMAGQKKDVREGRDTSTTLAEIDKAWKATAEKRYDWVMSNDIEFQREIDSLSGRTFVEAFLKE